jgi:glycosyltransferase involved in cell wall biosynthesis
MSAAAEGGGAPKDIVYVIASMITGGTQTHLLQVFRFLDRTRFRPHLFCLRDAGDLIEAARSLDVDVRTFGMKGSFKSPGDFAGLWRLRGAIAAVGPAVVHGYLLRGNFFGAAAARLAGVRAIVTSKRGHHEPAGPEERFAVRVSNTLSRVVTGNSPAVLEFTREVEAAVPEPMKMIPSGIDTDRFTADAVEDLRAELGLGDAPVIGSAITWRPRKGFRMLFEAFAEVRKAIPGAKLLLAGVDEWVGPPAELSVELGIRDDITLLGRRDDMPRVLKTLDIFVLPSESEGMSNAVLEAMSMGRPVVATAVGGNPYVIDEGKTGFLVAYEDVPALVDRLTRILSGAVAGAEIGAAARAEVERSYSARSMVREMEDLYDEVIGRS